MHHIANEILSTRVLFGFSFVSIFFCFQMDHRWITAISLKLTAGASQVDGGCVSAASKEKWCIDCSAFFEMHTLCTPSHRCKLNLFSATVQEESCLEKGKVKGRKESRNMFLLLFGFIKQLSVVQRYVQTIHLF